MKQLFICMIYLNGVKIMDTKKEIKTRELLEEKEAKQKIKENYSQLTTIPLRLLSELEDVDIASLTNLDTLIYDSTSGKWQNSSHP